MRAFQAVTLTLTLVIAGSLAAVAEEKMSVEKSTFGKLPDGREVEQYTLKNGRGVTAKIITYGAILTSLEAPDRDGKPGEITLGFDSLDPYLAGHPYFGATVGRFANRIAKGRFIVDGAEYQVATNNGPNHLHGGIKGFDKVLWTAEPLGRGLGVTLTHVSPDGDEGYPGKLSIKVVYTLTDNNELQIDYTATTDKTTPINLTNHTYWNLADGGKSDVLGHVLTLNADRYLPVDANLIPTGELKAVRGTPMDFTKPTAIGSRIGDVPGEPNGYDHCYVLNQKSPGDLTLAARVKEPTTGRVMEIRTTEPAIQLYTGNFLDGTLKSRGAVYKQHHAFCLEAEHYPDAVNQPKFPSALLKPGQTYRQTTIHKFSVE
jgi:aldose 1-epimerase